MASNLLKTFEKIERGRQKCIAVARAVNHHLPDDASLEQIASCIDSAGYASEYKDAYSALLAKDFSKLNNTLRMPDTLEKLGTYALYGVEVDNIIWPENLKEIGDYAFYCIQAPNLDVVIPDTVTKLGKTAFGFTSLTPSTLLKSIYVGPNVTEIGANCFNYMSYTTCKIVFDGRVKEIPEKAFAYASISASAKKITFTEEAINAFEVIGTYAFYEHYYTDVNLIGPNVRALDTYALRYVHHNAPVVLGPKLTSLGNNCLSNSKFLNGLDMTNIGATSISDNAFNVSEFNQDYLLIPEQVTHLGSYAFAGIYKTPEVGSSTKRNIAKVELMGKQLTTGSYTFQNAYITELIIHSGFNNIMYQNNHFTSANIFNIIFTNIPAGVSGKSGMFNTTGLSKGGLYLPDDVIDYYRTAANWSTYASYMKPLSTWSGYADYIASHSTEE